MSTPNNPNPPPYNHTLTLFIIPIPPNSMPESWMEMALQGYSQTLHMMMGPVPISITIQDPYYLERLANLLLHQGLSNFGHQLWQSTLLQAQYMISQQPLLVEELNSLMDHLYQIMTFFPLMDLSSRLPPPAFTLWP